LIDVTGAAALLVLCSPVLLLAALLVKFGDGGPCLYRRRVIGSRGEFDAYKLRTMRVDADQILQRNPPWLAEYEQTFKLRNDPRITRIGVILRKYSLDELPQLVNVIRGEMSLVGPRMISPPELLKYGSLATLFCEVKPGLTGYWQVNGRQHTSYAERVQMDAFYIENWTLLLDLRILLATPFKVLKGEGAY
jgi:lipopolysaccharide/colanic/teichoic acid biosynthesis glycosyltransferase